MAEGLVLFAPAKLNLGLRVTGRYADGYHHLESLLLSITLYDRLEVRRSAAGTVRYLWHFAKTRGQKRALAQGVAAHPLLWKSIAGFGQGGDKRGSASVMEFHSPSYGIPEPFSITVHKHIPSPSGLGGASADAAALIAHLAGLSGPGQATWLLQAAGRLGADIPFFLQYGLWGVPACLSGVGAELQLVALPPLVGIVAVPPFGFSTAAMFGFFREQNLPLRQEGIPPVSPARPGKSALRLDEIAHLDERFPGVRVAQNDFERAAAAVFPHEARCLAAAQEKIARTVRQFFPVAWLAGLTGSGPALYAVTESPLPAAGLKRLSSVLQYRLGALWQVYPVRNHRL